MLVPQISPKLTIGLLLVVVLNLALSGVTGTAAAQTTAQKLAEQWQDSSLKIAENTYLCVDSTSPDYLLTSLANGNGIFAVNWRTGITTKLTDQTFHSCYSEKGLVRGIDSATNKSFYYSRQMPKGKEVWGNLSDGPFDIAYNLSSDGKKLQITLDEGTTYRAIPLPPGDKAVSVRLPNTADGHALYVVMRDKELKQFADTTSFSLYFTNDFGTTWEKRYTPADLGAFSGGSAELLDFNDFNSSVDMVWLKIQSTGGPSSLTVDLYLSLDGGRNFAKQGAIYRVYSVYGLFQTSAGLVRLRPDLQNDYTKSPVYRDVSTDGGKTWQATKLPFLAGQLSFMSPMVQQARSAPDNLFVSDGNDLWYSADAGFTWEKIWVGALREYRLTPYLPLSVVGVKPDGTLMTLKLPTASASAVKPAIETKVAGSLYFDKVQHNLASVFTGYWSKFGGLAQFGYPKTELLLEVSQTDGNIYYTQYFERNRFEYHRENNPPYDVLLGLLGSELTKTSYADNPNFKRVENPNRSSVNYFAETGHTLGGKFKDYWERNGGLFVYGYPISEVFEERNPDDGKLYQVQYFERNRLELHSENAGTPYEVLLGLLGNSLLRQKGWFS